MKRKGITALVWILLVGLVFVALVNHEDARPARVTSPEDAIERISSGDVISFRREGPDFRLETSDGESLVVRPPLGDLWSAVSAANLPIPQAME